MKNIKILSHACNEFQIQHKKNLIASFYGLNAKKMHDLQWLVLLVPKEHYEEKNSKQNAVKMYNWQWLQRCMNVLSIL